MACWTLKSSESGVGSKRLTGLSRGMLEVRPLQDAAQEFAAELADRVSRYLDRECTFTSTATPNGRVVVTDQDDDGIPLHINGEPLLVLSVDIRCHWDSRSTY